MDHRLLMKEIGVQMVNKIREKVNSIYCDPISIEFQQKDECGIYLGGFALVALGSGELQFRTLPHGIATSQYTFRSLDLKITDSSCEIADKALIMLSEEMRLKVMNGTPIQMEFKESE